MALKDIFIKNNQGNDKPDNIEERSMPIPRDDEEYSMYGCSVNFFNPYGNSHSSRSLSAVYGCVELISNAVSCIPLRVMRVDADEHMEYVAHHPLQRVFKDKMRSNMEVRSMVKHAISDMLLKGNGYIYVKRGESGVITGLRYLNSVDVNIVYNEKTDTLHYLCPKISTKKIKSTDMIHFVKNTNDGIHGIPVMRFAQDALNLAHAANDSAKKYFDSGCNLNGILVPKAQVLNEKQRQDVKNTFTENGKTNSINILPYGVDYQQLGSTGKDSQMLETRQFNVVEICRFFGVNPVLLQDLTKVSFSTLEQINLQFMQYTLLPYVKMIEAEFTRKIFLEDDDLIVDMDINSYLMRTDKSTTASYYNTFVQSGILSINEVRRELGLSEIEDGDKHYLAYQDASKADIQNKPSNDENL